MRILTILITLLSLCLTGFSQDLKGSIQTSFYRYLYKISNEEARLIHKKGLEKSGINLRDRVAIDSLPAQKAVLWKQSAGNFVEFTVIKGGEDYEYVYERNCHVILFNDRERVKMRVYNNNGSVVKDVQVFVRGKRVAKGCADSCFNLGKVKTYKVVEVSNAGVSNFFIVHNDVDRYKPQPRYKRFFKVWYWRSLFDGERPAYNPKYSGYSVFSKPRYRLGDTLKVKAFILDSKGIPYNKPVNISIPKYQLSKEFKVRGVAPYRPGAFTFSIPLVDSLDLKLDRSYTLEFTSMENENGLLSASFYFEDYELNSLSLDIRTEADEHYQGKPLSLWVKGTNDNGMNLQDARIKVLLTPVSVNKIFGRKTMVGDTIWMHTRNLEPAGETEVVILDSLFAKMNLEYNIRVELTTSDNEVITESKEINFYWDRSEIKGTVVNDSLNVRFFKNSVDTLTKICRIAYDVNNNEMLKDSLTLPYQFKLNPLVKRYEFSTDSSRCKEDVTISSSTSGVEVLTQRTADSVFVRLVNPNRVMLNYAIFKGTSKIAEGFTDSLTYAGEIPSESSCMAYVQYLWGGETVKETIPIALHTQRLNLSIDAPKLIVPGQAVDLKVTAKDFRGNVVPDADVTMLGITSKFNSGSPNMFGYKARKVLKYPRQSYNFTMPEFDEFEVKEDESYDERFSAWCSLRYSYWNPRLMLDSAEFYKFLYPKNGLYESVEKTKDGSTEFAPFVVRSGEQREIHVIYVDEVPVYYSWSSIDAPYSFRIREGLHTIGIRTSDRLITLKWKYFKKGEKKIISLCDSLPVSDVHVKEMPTSFTEQEKQQLSKYLFPYRDIKGAAFAYLKQGDNIILLKRDNRRIQNSHVGPVTASEVVMSIPNGYSTAKIEPEPGFEYEFLPSLVKMRTIDIDKRFPHALTHYSTSYPFSDEVLTEKEVWKMDSTYQRNSRIPRYNSYPYNTSAGFGRIVLKQADTKNEKVSPQNVVVYNKRDMFETRVYVGDIRGVEMLATDSEYTVNVLYSNGALYSFDSLVVKSFSTLYLNLPSGETLKPTAKSKAIAALIDSLVYQKRERDGVVAGQLNAYNPNLIAYDGVGFTIEGYVVAADDKQPLPGVMVVGTGSKYGVVTDISGRYRIKIPYSVKSLTFNFIGFNQAVIDVENKGALGKVVLSSDMQRLDEVVVLGYGVSRRSKFVGSVSSASEIVQEENFFVDDALQGRVPGVQIRGNNSLAGSGKPIYIVDGKVAEGYVSSGDVEKMEVLKGSNDLVAIYGSEAANGVIIITTKKGKGMEFDADFMAQAMQSSGMRSRFSDDAFWFPALRTDENGMATIRVKFPDDITQWKAYALGVSDTKRLSGIAATSIKSMKPMNATLSLPRFLVQGDTAKAIGKVLNYTADTLNVKAKFQINGNTEFTKGKTVVNSAIDSLQVVAASTDTLKLRYIFEMDNGYSDGEERSVNVVRKGLERSVGQFRMVKGRDSVAVSLKSASGRLNVAVDATPLSLVKEKAQELTEYKYECNEQLASKLKGWLALKELKQLQCEKFKGDGEINRIINKLKKSVNPDGLWGWWSGCYRSWEMSAHIIEALNLAQKMGYNAAVDFTKVKNELAYSLPKIDRYNMLSVLNILSLIDAKVDYSAVLDTLRKPALTLDEQVLVANIRNRVGLPSNLELLKKYMVKTIKGNSYLKDTVRRFLFYNDELLTNINALKLFGADTSSRGKDQELLGYLLEYISDRSFMNTYEKSNFVMAAIPAMKRSGAKELTPKLQLLGDTSLVVSKFPFVLKDISATNLTFCNRADAPLYVSISQKEFEENPKSVDSLFVVKSRFIDGKGTVTNRFVGGEKITMEVDVKAKKMAKYVMVRIPIPAGCTYASKETFGWREAYREYYEDCVCIFLENMSVGDYRYTINLLPRYDGTYTVNPSKVEPMYSPTMMGNNSNIKVKIGK